MRTIIGECVPSLFCYSLPGVVFLDVAAQEALRYQTTALLPFESYTRKAVGYLFAIGVRGLLNKKEAHCCSS